MSQRISAPENLCSTWFGIKVTEFHIGNRCVVKSEGKYEALANHSELNTTCKFCVCFSGP